MLLLTCSFTLPINILPLKTKQNKTKTIQEKPSVSILSTELDGDALSAVMSDCQSGQVPQALVSRVLIGCQSGIQHLRHWT